MIHTKANLISPKFEQQLNFSFSSMLNARTKRERESSRPTFHENFQTSNFIKRVITTSLGKQKWREKGTNIGE